MAAMSASRPSGGSGLGEFGSARDSLISELDSRAHDHTGRHPLQTIPGTPHSCFTDLKRSGVHIPHLSKSS